MCYGYNTSYVILRADGILHLFLHRFVRCNVFLMFVSVNSCGVIWLSIRKTSSSAMAEGPRELDQRFQVGGQFEAKL